MFFYNNIVYLAKNIFSLKNLEQITRQAISVVEQAGRFLQKAFSENQPREIVLKSVNQLVTHIDKTSETILVTGLREVFPEAGFLTEEETVEQEQKEYRWIIDPLDGTTNFLHGIPFFGISVALVHGDELLIGIVFDVMHQDCFWVHSGIQTHLNDTLIHVTNTVNMADSLVATGFPYYDYSLTAPYLSILEELMKTTRGVRRLGAASLDLAYVACGRFDAFYEYSLSPWDVAAGALLVQQAGGKITDFSGGNDFIYGKSILATNARLHDSILSVIRKNILI